MYSEFSEYLFQTSFINSTCGLIITADLFGEYSE